MIVHELPLLDLFNSLREADLPLGVDDYEALLLALQGGFGIATEDALVRLCKMLWVKSTDDEHLFDYHFERIMGQSFKSGFSSQKSVPPSELKRKSPASSLAQDTQLADSFPIPTSEPVLQVEDDVQVAKVMSQTLGKDEAAYSQFLQTDEYLPVTRRQMKQSWRYLRRSVREGLPSELDMNATIKAIGRQGMFFELALVPQRVNRAELLLLIDQDGSMAPFHVISRRLVETALRGGRLGRTGNFYFHNCPVAYLYGDPGQHKAIPFKTILTKFGYEQTGVLIFSDAGAARGGMNPERFDFTRQFLEQFRQNFRFMAWLNPVPRERWLGTTAGEISHLIPMFDIRRRGLDSAINVLRGRYSNIIDALRQSFYA